MDQETKAFFRKLCDGPGNKQCIDCDAAHPQWASLSYGTYFCLNCSGVHRSLGVHLSFVRSISMDTWTEKQKTMMQAGGNEAFKKFAVAQQIDGMNIRDKYNTIAAEYYRNMLKAKVEGTPMPSLPPNGTGKNLTSGGSVQSKPMGSMGGGFGSGGPAPSMSSSAGPRSSMASSGYGLSYQGGSSGGNPYQYNNGAGNQGGDLFSSAAGFFQGAVAAGNQFAAQASTKLTEAKIQAQNDGWFDFDNLQEQASAFANQAKQKAAELAGQEGATLSQPGGFGNQNYQPQNQNFPGFGNNSNSLQPAAGQQARPSMSSVTASPAPSVNSTSRAQSVSSAPATNNSASQPSIASKPIMFRSNSPPRMDKKQANMSLTPDLSKSASKKNDDNEKKSDLWDSEAWFDDM